MLSDIDIRWRMSDHQLEEDRLIIKPYPEDRAFQPASIDLRLDVWDYLRPVDDGEGVIRPNEFQLANTIEHVDLPTDLAARIEGKSSLGRLGLAVHITAGFVDPGFSGQLVLELKNLGNQNIPIYRGMFIAQLSFFQLSSKSGRPYGSRGLNSHYQGQRGLTRSWMENDELG